MASRRYDRASRNVGYDDWAGFIGTVKRKADLSQIVVKVATIRKWKPGSESSGTGCCPFHDDRNPSFSVCPGGRRWRCHAGSCGASGDQIDFLRRYCGYGFVEAALIAAAMADMAIPEIIHKGTHVKPPQPTRPNDCRAEPETDQPAVLQLQPALEPPEPAVPVPGRKFAVWSPRLGRRIFWTGSMIHPYRTIKGRLLGLTVRIDTRNGKRVLPLSWRKVEGNPCWVNASWVSGRMPVYGLSRLGNRVTADAARPLILVVEGEKAADHGQGMLGMTCAVISPMGGCRAVGRADWQPVAGLIANRPGDRPCRITVWPDADPLADWYVAGVMNGIAGSLGGMERLRHLCQLYHVPPRREWPAGFDIADLCGDVRRTGRIINAARCWEVQPEP